ncbi:hypothetical protein NQ176_g414 [Zarea fungicola]|uniref:Uncharacterized protein n=1 Tax=Zarea fungicola TaxID=93591 RepID=A0ACC1NWX1_9HYPO|nr:hypothetical protein NQ176_g414 [Lecanicillium fungicola]
MASGLAQKYEINADMGEGFGQWKMGPDEELMPFIDAANIACAFHAGDPSIMLKTIRLCKKYGVRAGAHPGLQDLFGFGRRRMEIDPADMPCWMQLFFETGCRVYGTQVDRLASNMCYGNWGPGTMKAIKIPFMNHNDWINFYEDKSCRQYYGQIFDFAGCLNIPYMSFYGCTRCR